MRKFFNFLLVAVAALVALWINMRPSMATVDYGKKEKLACTYCHPAGKMKELSDAGKYYKDHDLSMKGYEAPKGSTK